MSIMILTQTVYVRIYININSINMLTVKFINKIISIYFFSSYPFNLRIDQCYSIYHWSSNFWEMFSLILLLKNFSRMKRWWREELKLLVTIKRSFGRRYKWRKLFERCGQLRLFPKQILCQRYSCF